LTFYRLDLPIQNLGNIIKFIYNSVMPQNNFKPWDDVFLLRNIEQWQLYEDWN
jgi:hypothetical protein